MRFYTYLNAPDYVIFRSMITDKTPDELGILLIDHIRLGLTIEDARAAVEMGPNLGLIEQRTGFTVFHAAAAVGRRDLFDLFREVAKPDFQLKDKSGWSIGDLAAILANDFDFVSHIYEVEADETLGDPSPQPI